MSRLLARRRLGVLLAAGVLALAGCGGDPPLAPQTEGAPPMPVPEAAEPPGGEPVLEEDAATEEGITEEVVPEDTGAATAPGDATAQVAPAAEAEVEAETPEVAAPEAVAPAPEATGGGAVAPEAAEDGPANDIAPPAGSNAERYETFCAENPGAC